MRPSMPNPLSAVDEGRPADSPARRFRPRLVPTLAAIAAMAVCVAAGNWQRDRMHAKESLRRQYDAAAAAAPVALASLPAAADWPSLRYRPVTATGEYLADRQIFIDNKVAAGPCGLSRRDAALACRRSCRAGQSRLDRAEVLPRGVAGRAAAARRGDGAGTHRDPGGGLSGSSSPRRRAVRSGRTSIPRASPRRRVSRHCLRSSRQRRRPCPTTDCCATGRRRISASKRTGSTWCSGTHSRCSRPGCGSGSIDREPPGSGHG